jgi:hypothetical protein
MASMLAARADGRPADPPVDSRAMAGVHTVVGFVVLAVFTTGWIWAGGAALLRRDPGSHFWTWLVVAQVIAGLQALVGVILLVSGARPSTWLHLVYGFGPLLILGVGHGLARELRRGRVRFPIEPWGIFGLAAFICFGLSLRALMTGLGLG